MALKASARARSPPPSQNRSSSIPICLTQLLQQRRDAHTVVNEVGCFQRMKGRHLFGFIDAENTFATSANGQFDAPRIDDAFRITGTQEDLGIEQWLP